MEYTEDHKLSSFVQDGYIMEEKDILLDKAEEGESYGRQHKSKPGWYWLLVLALVGCGVSLFWLFSDCSLASQVGKHEVPPPAHDLATKAARAPAAAASSGVLECFQVYQPVFFPSGAVDGTITSDGSENTTTISPAAPASSCEVLLMEHSFGFSYGIPFVGLLPRVYRTLLVC